MNNILKNTLLCGSALTLGLVVGGGLKSADDLVEAFPGANTPTTVEALCHDIVDGLKAESGEQLFETGFKLADQHQVVGEEQIYAACDPYFEGGFKNVRR